MAATCQWFGLQRVTIAPGKEAVSRRIDLPEDEIIRAFRSLRERVRAWPSILIEAEIRGGVPFSGEIRLVAPRQTKSGSAVRVWSHVFASGGRMLVQEHEPGEILLTVQDATAARVTALPQGQSAWICVEMGRISLPRVEFEVLVSLETQSGEGPIQRPILAIWEESGVSLGDVHLPDEPPLTGALFGRLKRNGSRVFLAFLGDEADVALAAPG